MPEISNLPKPQSLNTHPKGLLSYKKHSGRNIPKLAIIIVAIVMLLIAGLIIFCSIQLSPAGNNTSELKKIVITEGSTSNQIGKELQDKAIIRSSLAFDIYMRLAVKNDILKAGTYRLSPADSLSQIVGHLTKGSNDTFNITFYPGASLKDTTNTPRNKKYDVTTVLENAGYSKDEISAAFTAKYDTKTDLLLFADNLF